MTTFFVQNDKLFTQIIIVSERTSNAVKQASRPQVIHKTQLPICLDYRARNRPQLFGGNAKFCSRNLDIGCGST